LPGNLVGFRFALKYFLAIGVDVVAAARRASAPATTMVACFSKS